MNSTYNFGDIPLVFNIRKNKSNELNPNKIRLSFCIYIASSEINPIFKAITLEIFTKQYSVHDTPANYNSENYTLLKVTKECFNILENNISTLNKIFENIVTEYIETIRASKYSKERSRSLEAAQHHLLKYYDDAKENHTYLGYVSKEKKEELKSNTSSYYNFISQEQLNIQESIIHRYGIHLQMNIISIGILNE